MFEIIPFGSKNRASLYNPFKEMEDFEKNLFGSLSPYFSRNSIEPFKTDIKETDGGYTLEADLPGFNKEDIDVQIDGDYLTIKAERHSEHEDKDKKDSYLRVERSYGSYQRSFDITGVDAEHIGAKYENGVLTLTMPKKEPEVPTARKLAIE
ncbi:MAG: Hsp20/alpha crystallin family protein [Clostridia bacterium]|nr:Hsp20/alpha crystallin family protein [Clostridia bacterium]